MTRRRGSTGTIMPPYMTLTSPVEDQLRAMLRTEKAYTPSVLSPNNKNDTIYAEWRSKICDWSYRVVDHFGYDRELVAVAMNCFDRYWVHTSASFGGTSKCVESRTYQLAAMTSLYVAAKLHADRSERNQDDVTTTKKKLLRITSFVQLSRDQFSPRDIAVMEQHLLEVLGWRVNPPTPMLFVGHLLRIVPAFAKPGSTASTSGSAGSGRSNTDATSQQHRALVIHVLHELARYLTELSTCLPPSATATSSSEMAYASILLALDLLSSDTALPASVRAEYLSRLDYLSGGTLTESRDKLVQLKKKIGQAFLPVLLRDALEQAASGRAGGDGGHPLLIARDAGLLSEEVQRRFNSAKTTTPTATAATALTPASLVEMEVEFDPPPSEPPIVRRHFDQLVLSSSNASADSFFEDDIIEPETKRNRSINSVAEWLHQHSNDKKRSDKYAVNPHYPFHTAALTEMTREVTREVSTDTASSAPGHVRRSSSSSWMSDSSESPTSVIAEAINAAGDGGASNRVPSGSGLVALPPTNHPRGYLL